MQSISKSEVVNARYERELADRSAHLAQVKAEYAKAAGTLASLKIDYTLPEQIKVA